MRVQVKGALEIGDRRVPPELRPVMVDAVRLSLDQPRTPAEIVEDLTRSGLRARRDLVERSCRYLFWAGEAYLDPDGRYRLRRQVEISLRRRAVS